MTKNKKKNLFQTAKRKDTILHMWFVKNKKTIKKVSIFIGIISIMLIAGIDQYNVGIPFIFNRLFSSWLDSYDSITATALSLALIVVMLGVLCLLLYIATDAIITFSHYLTFLKRQSYLPLTKEECEALHLYTIKDYAEFIYDLRNVKTNKKWLENVKCYYNHTFELFDKAKIYNFARDLYKVIPGSEEETYLIAGINWNFTKSGLLCAENNRSFIDA